MALVYSNKTEYNGNDNPIEILYTCAANVKLLVVGIAIGGNGSRSGTAPTYNSVELTQAGNTQNAAAEVACELWYMLNPPTEVEHTIAIPNTDPDACWVSVASFTSSVNVLFDQADGTVVTQADPSLTLNGVPAGAAVVDFAMYRCR